MHDLNNGAPQVHRRNGTLVLVYPNQKPTVPRGKRGKSVHDIPRHDVGNSL